MCPSRRPFEKGFFTAVADLSRQSGRGTPVAIAITGNWLENHRDDLGWIVQQIKKEKLAVTWVSITPLPIPMLPGRRWSGTSFFPQVSISSAKS